MKEKIIETRLASKRIFLLEILADTEGKWEAALNKVEYTPQFYLWSGAPLYTQGILIETFQDMVGCVGISLDPQIPTKELDKSIIETIKSKAMLHDYLCWCIDEFDVLTDGGEIDSLTDRIWQTLPLTSEFLNESLGL